MNPILATALGEIGKIFITNSTEAIHKRIETAKLNNDKEAALQSLEAIINELIDERAEFQRTIQLLEEEISIQKISDEDIIYINENLIPQITKLLEESDDGENTEELEKGLEIIKPLLSKEMLTIFQLIGFNYKEAIGQPLTKLIRAMITKNIPTIPNETSQLEKEVQLQVSKTNESIFNLLQQEDGLEKYQKALQNNVE